MTFSTNFARALAPVAMRRRRGPGGRRGHSPDMARLKAHI